jgi:hypothetical protein
LTNPDTNTLNGALEQLGITMAENLVTMGVSDADPSDGLTTLAGKILEIAPVPPTPTPASIDLTGTKSILSYADSESCVLTATVLDSSDNPVEGVDVNLYNGSTLWDTLTTDSSGECSKTYSSAGAGDITFTAEVDGTLLTKTYAVEDCLYYSNSYNKIKSDCTANAISDRTIYSMNTNYQTDVEMTWKLKNSSMPSSWGFGFGDGANLKAKLMAFRLYAYNRYWHVFYSTNSQENRMDDGGSVLSNSTVNSIYKLTTSNLHKISLYVDDVIVGYRDTKTSFGLNLRIDDFTASPLELDYLKIKPL